MILLLLLLPILLLLLTLPSVLVSYREYNKYPYYYNRLNVDDFRKATTAHNQVSSSELTWFASRNVFMSRSLDLHLSNAPYTWFDPYTVYWYFKYKRWFDENCSHLKYSNE